MHKLKFYNNNIFNLSDDKKYLGLRFVIIRILTFHDNVYFPIDCFMYRLSQ